jgi:Cu2+-exporting ATPase
MTALPADLSGFLIPVAESTARLDLAVDGMRCAGCMATIEREVGRLDGVVAARVNLTDKRLRLTVNDTAAPARVLRCLEDLGFRAYPFSPRAHSDESAREQRRLTRALVVAGVAAMNIMLLSVSVWSGHASELDPLARDFFHWISALIALPTAAYSGRPFFDSAMRALKARRVNMDVPISLGICLALGLSVFETWASRDHAYFDGVVMLLFLLLIGRVLEQAMHRRTRAVAANLTALRAEHAVVAQGDGTWTSCPVDTVGIGARVLVRPGERIPLDGAVLSGRSDIDQSLVTGETAPRAVNPGDTVYAGTLSLSGTLTVRVDRAHDRTLLADVERLLAQASETKGAYVTLADRAARLYPPIVHTVALATFLGWMLWGLGWAEALAIAITVLIITCPCALGLAVPTVQIVAAGALFKRGVLVNAGDALERLAVIDHVVFDKTGTLTEPTPTIANLDQVPEAIRAVAGRLALSSRHPLAAAIARATGAREPLEDTVETPGAGVSAMLDGVEVRLGSPAFVGAEASAGLLADHYPSASMVAVRVGEATAVFALLQPVRPDAAATIAAFAEAHVPVEILSGDRPAAVAEVAATLAVPTWTADARPADKVDRLSTLTEAGAHPLMIGDGVNDAPALAAAHASIAPVSAAHVTQARADFLLIGNRLGLSLDSIQIARRARRLMMQNLWFSALYNLIAVPIAVTGHATPLVAALAMSGSSLIVMVNALRAQTPEEIRR